MPDGGTPLFISAASIVDIYFDGRDVTWLYRQKKRWRDAGTPFPEPLAGTYLYSRNAIDDWMAVMAANSRASGNLLGGPGRHASPVEASPFHPMKHGHDDGPAARLDARARALAADTGDDFLND